MCAQAHHGEMGHREMGPWSTRISFHMRSPFRLTFFFKMAFNVTSRVMYPGTGWAEGLRVAAKGSGVSERVDGWGGSRRRGWAGCTALSESPLFRCYARRALPYTVTMT